MTSRKGKARQRQLARDKYERQLARRAASHRRRRQVKAGVGVLVVLVAGLAIAYFLGAFDGMLNDDKGSKPKDEPSASASQQSEDEKSDKDKGSDDKSAEETSGDADASDDKN